MQQKIRLHIVFQMILMENEFINTEMCLARRQTYQISSDNHRRSQDVIRGAIRRALTQAYSGKVNGELETHFGVIG
jgi:hypothetical protein